MNKIKQFLSMIKPKAKYLLGVLGVAAIVSQGAFAISNLQANSVRFNDLPGDQELLRGANSTKGETVWKDPVSGDAGDVFSGLVYYHNTNEGEIAENTRIKVTIPASTTNKTAKLKATISADNAETVSDTIVEGSGVTGDSGLTVNLSQDANLALVPGSVKWYPNRMNNPEGAASILPAGQSGDEIISANGINLGDINGCWPYAGYVIFQFKAEAKTADFGLEKSVRNLTRGENSYTELTQASANDVVEFKVRVVNSGERNLDNVILRDQLPAELGYQSGTMRLSKAGEGNYQSLSDLDAHKIFDEGLNIGSIAIGQSDYLIFSAKTPVSIATAKTVTNTAFATACGKTVSDIAKVELVPCSRKVELDKDAKNLTSGQNSSLREVAGRQVLALNALAGEEVKYTLSTKNTGNSTVENYVIQDGIADILEYADVIAVSNGGSVINGTSGNEAKLVSYPVVNIASGEAVVRTFTVKVKDPVPTNPANGYHFDMQMYNCYGDEVIVFISVPSKLPAMSIEKLVRNVSINEVNFVDEDSAISGDTLEYLVKFSNTGAGEASNLRFSDILPVNTAYVAGSTRVSIAGGAEITVADGVTSGGISVGNLAAGQSGYIKFKVTTAKGIASGTRLVNTATLTHSGISMSDTAVTVVKAPVVIAALPKTGANSTAVAAIAALLLTAGSAVALRRFA